MVTLGNRGIIELSCRLEATVGPPFDPGNFHDGILGSGSLREADVDRLPWAPYGFGSLPSPIVLGLDATPAQRLAWLEEAIRLAHASGALPRPSSAKTPEPAG